MANVVRDSGRVEVQIVEQVVDIDSQLNPGAFTQDRCFGQAKGLRQSQVHPLISGEVERIAVDTRGRGKRGAQESRVWRCRGKIRRATLRKVRVRNSLECIVAGAAARTPQEGGREQRPVTACSAIGVSVSDVYHWSPGESRVKIEDAAERPATSDLFHPAIAAVKEDRLPQAKKLKCLAYVVVAASVIQVMVEWVGLLRKRRGACVHALGPSELRVNHELVRELMLQFGEHGIVVSLAGNAP